MFMEFISFAFSGFWIFIGVILLISVISSGIAAIIKAFIPSQDVHYHIDGTDVDKNALKEFLEKRNE